MARRFATGFVAALITCSVLGAGSAVAATEIGSTCQATSTTLSAVAMQISRVTAPTQLSTTSPGVVTAWKIGLDIGFEPRVETLAVFKKIGSEYELIAESDPGTVEGGKLNQFPTRIPVAAGITFGATTTVGIPVCPGFPGDSFGSFGSSIPIGFKGKPPGTESGKTLSLAVVIEPDADGDGYGDETQDKCPQSAATQGACPAPPGGGATVKLKGKPKLEGNVVAVKLTTTAAVKVTVTGTIRGKRAASPASKAVSPGETGRVYLSLSKSVKRRLTNLPRKRKLRMVVEAKADGAPTVSAEIALPGRKKPPGRA